jgi:hypothetical protein
VICGGCYARHAFDRCARCMKDRGVNGMGKAWQKIECASEAMARHGTG